MKRRRLLAEKLPNTQKRKQRPQLKYAKNTKFQRFRELILLAVLGFREEVECPVFLQFGCNANKKGKKVSFGYFAVNGVLNGV